jgi:Bin/amphiphysin/Rvs domain for vesicular trafficking
LLSSAKSPAEAQAAFTAPPSAKPQPKTLSHAIARASLAGSQALNSSNPGASEDPLAAALEKYALAEEKIGEARMAQDAQIQQRFLAGFNTTLKTNIGFATRARTAVENARLALDATKARSPKGQALPEDARSDIEHKEDEFVGQTEEAVGVMKNV